MSDWCGAELARASAHLGAYARNSLIRAATLAGRLHAVAVSPEHWLAALLEDEECGATRAVLHAFADPETIGIEVRALCTGIMVVGSDRALPFSVGALRALGRARRAALERAAARVTPGDVFQAARGELPEALRARVPVGPESPEPAQGAEPFRADEPYFRHFAPEALRALGAACRAAASLERDAIGPAHLLLGCLDCDEDLRREVDLTAGRLRIALGGHDEDPTPLDVRPLEGDLRLVELLGRLERDAGTLEVLAELLVRGNEELIALLQRQKVTPALVERCRGGFSDPAG